LCPDISFFSQATAHPLAVVTQGSVERLHQRVQQARLAAQNVERKGLGMAKVRFAIEMQRMSVTMCSVCWWRLTKARPATMNKNVHNAWNVIEGEKKRKGIAYRIVKIHRYKVPNRNRTYNIIYESTTPCWSFLQLAVQSKKVSAESYAPLGPGQEAHWEVVERILFIYAKLNPGQGYVQGLRLTPK
jgi:hypothetical protein